MLIAERGDWKAGIRPPEAGIAEWSHKWRDATGHQLSPDTKAGPPITVQWQAGPALADGAGGGKTPVIAEGFFACVDDADGEKRSGKGIAVRSAGNGLSRLRTPRISNPDAELIIADGKLIVDARPLHVIDLRTGADAVLAESARKGASVIGKESGPTLTSTVVAEKILLTCEENELVAVDLPAGGRRWSNRLDDAVWFSPRITGGLAIAVECPLAGRKIKQDAAIRIMSRGRYDDANVARAVTAFRLTDGKQVWRTPIEIPTPAVPPEKWPIGKDGKPHEPERAALKPLICVGDMILLYTSMYQARADDSALHAMDVATGKFRWSTNLPEGSRPGRISNTDSANAILVRGGEIFYIGGHGPGGIIRIDPATGAIKGPATGRFAQFAYAGECSMSRGTVNWFNKSAVTWYGPDLQPIARPAVRGQCGSGVFPAQGMVFATPIGCDCSNYARGYIGMACEPDEAVSDANRLTVGGGTAGQTTVKPGDWPVFLGNNQRSARTIAALPDRLASAWNTSAAPAPIAGPLAEDRRRDEYWVGGITAPVVAGGTVYAGLPDAHAVVAIDAATGKLKWRVPVGGPVDTPPTIAGGLAVVGCQDGAIYALSTTDGALVWRFDGARGKRLAMLNGRLASAHPAPGSVIVQKDKVLATVGYHAWLGGIAGWVLDLATGKPLARQDAAGVGLDGSVDAAAVRGAKGAPGVANVLNDILVEAADGGLWIGDNNNESSLRLAADGKLAMFRRYQKDFPAAPATMTRRNSIVAFTSAGRGGSTHPWLQTQGAVKSGDLLYSNRDALICQRVSADGKKREPVWTVPAMDLGGIERSDANARQLPETTTALIMAGERLYAAGGRYDGTSGWLCAVGLDGKIVQRLPLPSRPVASGLAAADGRLFVSCIDGRIVCFGAP